MTESNITVNLKQIRNENIKSISVSPNIPISDFRQRVSEELNIPVDQIRLIFRGRALKPDKNLSDYNIEDGHTIQIVPNQPRPNSSSTEVPPPPPINLNPQVTVTQVVHRVNNNGNPVNVTTNPAVYTNLCNVQYILSQLQLSAANLQNTILNEDEQTAANKVNEFFNQFRTKQIELKSAVDNLRLSSYGATQQTTTTTQTISGPNADGNNPNMAQGNNPFVPLQNTINSILGQIFNPH